MHVLCLSNSFSPLLPLSSDDSTFHQRQVQFIPPLSYGSHSKQGSIQLPEDLCKCLCHLHVLHLCGHSKVNFITSRFKYNDWIDHYSSAFLLHLI